MWQVRCNVLSISGSLSPEKRACLVCCECARLAETVIDLAHEGWRGLRVFVEASGARVDRPFGPRDFGCATERLWATLQATAGPLAELSGKLAHITVGPPIKFGDTYETSYHATAAGLAFCVVTNARMAAGYPRIFPFNTGTSPFVELCRAYPKVFEDIAAQGWGQIGTRWRAVRANLAVFPSFDARVLTALIRKEAEEVAKYRRLGVNETTHVITLDGVAYPAVHSQAFRMFVALYRAWLEDKGIQSIKDIQRTQRFHGDARLDRYLRQLPAAIQQIVVRKTGRGGGYLIQLPEVPA
jgi:hypothetical protein